MPRIRKKTSKRVTTHQRAKIKHKVAEGRKKKKKEAKKSTQWKSKKKKDPGIPNEFPYKEQILAEVAEARRQAEEAKQRRREEKKAAREEAGAPAAQQGQHGVDDDTEESSSSQRAPDDAPLLLSPDLPNLEAVLAKADVVLHVLDARDPLSFRLAHLEDVVSAAAKAELVFVLNKIDLVPRENVAAWAQHLRTQRPTFLFRSASAPAPGQGRDAIVKGKEKETHADAAGVKALLGYLARRAEKVENAPLQVAVVGLTNTGKSAVINSLAGKAAVPVYVPTPSADARSTTTTRAVEVSVETPSHKKITLIDTPGVSFSPSENDGDEGALKIRDLLLRSRGRIDKLKDPVPAVAHIVARATARDLMVHYALPAFTTGDTAAFLAGVARARGMAARMGAPDTLGAARGVLRDWADGRLPRCADAPPAPEAGTEAEVGDEKVLGAVRTRAEMRRGRGIVVIVSGEVERRRVQLEKAFDGQGEESEASDDGGDDEGDVESADDDDDGDEEEEEGADEEAGTEADADGDIQPATPTSRKRKRNKGFAAGEMTEHRMKKKVAFAAGTIDHHERKHVRRLPTKSTPKPAKAAARPAKASARPAAKVTKKQQATTVNSEAYDFGQFFS